MAERKAERVRPRSAVTAAIEEFDRIAFGIVANISEGGACLCTDQAFPVGESLHIRLSFESAFLEFERRSIEHLTHQHVAPLRHIRIG